MPEYEVKLKVSTDASGAISGIKGVSQGLKELEASSRSAGSVLESAWTKAAAGIAAAGYAASKAFDLADLGAKAMQAEESFRLVAKSYSVDADQMIAAMKRVSNATVNESDAMQKAVKGMVQGLNADQIVNIMEAARVAARVAGEDVGEAFDEIVDAIGNKAPRALLKYGLVTKEQMKLVNQAISQGVEEIGLYEIAMANAAEQQAAFGTVTETAAERVQQAKSAIDDFKEMLGKGLWPALEYVTKGVLWLTSGVNQLGVGVTTVIEKLAGVNAAMLETVGLDTLAQKYRALEVGARDAAEAFRMSSDDLMERIVKEAEAHQSVQTKMTVTEAEEQKKRAEARLKAAVNEKKQQKELAAHAKKVVEDETRLSEELRKKIAENAGATYDTQIALLEAEYEKYAEKVKDKVLLEEWLASEKKRIWQEFYIDDAEWQSWLNETTMQMQADALEEQEKARQEELDEYVETLRRKRDETQKTTQEMTNSYAEFFANIFGMGEDLASWWSSLGSRLKGGLLAGVSEVAIGAITGMGSQGYSASGRFVSGLFGGGGGGGVNIPFGSLFSGATIGQIPYQLAMALPTWLPGYETFFGGLAGIGDAFAGGGLLGAIGSIPLAAIGALAGVGSLVYSLAKRKSARHRMRRKRRGAFWQSELGTLAGADTWEDMIEAAGAYPLYRGGRDWLSGGGAFRPLTPENAPGSAWGDWTSGAKIQWAGWKHTKLKEQMSEEDYWKTLAYWDDIAAAALNSLNEQKQATTATLAELGKYKDVIEKTRELMPGWGEDAQNMAEAMLAMYENMQQMALDDIWKQFEEGKILFSDLSKAIDELDLDPMTKATELASRAFKGFSEDVDVGTDKFWELYKVFKEQTAAAGDLATAQQRLDAVGSVLSTNMNLTQDQVIGLVTYYRLLKDVLEGNIESVEDLGEAWAKVQGIVEAAMGVSTAQQLQIARWQHAGVPEVEQGWATIYQRWGWGSDMTRERIAAGVDWALTKATIDELTAIAKQHGMTVEQLIADLQWMDSAIKGAAETMEQYQAGIRDTASLMAVARARMRGATPEEVEWVGIRQRWGWIGDNQKSEEQIRAGIEWFLNQATPEQIYGMAQAKGMSVQQMIDDLLFMGEQLGYFGDAVEDATDAIEQWKGAVQSWANVAKALTEQIRGIEFSEANPQTARERMGLVYRTIQEITGGRSVAAYLGGIGDVEARQAAVSELSGLWGEYLKLAQEVYQRPSIEYQQQYDLTLENLKALKAYSLSEYDIAVKQLQALEQIVVNTSPEPVTPAGGDGAAAGGSATVDSQGHRVVTFASGGRMTYSLSGYAANYVAGVGEVTSFDWMPPTDQLPPNYHWVRGYSMPGERPFWYAVANSPKDAIPMYHSGGLVRQTGLIYAEEGEYVVPKNKVGKGSETTNINVTITVNGANKVNAEVAREIRAEVISALRTAQAGAIIKGQVRWGGRG